MIQKIKLNHDLAKCFHHELEHSPALTCLISLVMQVKKTRASFLAAHTSLTSMNPTCPCLTSRWHFQPKNHIRSSNQSKGIWLSSLGTDTFGITPSFMSFMFCENIQHISQLYKISVVNHEMLWLYMQLCDMTAVFTMNISFH